MSLVIREGTPDDAEIVLTLVRRLAEYERLAHEATATVDDFRSSLADGDASVLIAEWDGSPCGLALYFFNYSTFLGRRGLYLEDLYVDEAMRGRGIGKALLARLAAVAVEKRCGRMEWSVLDWNEPSIAFYKALGAVAMDEWTVYRLTGEPLQALAKEAQS